MEKIYDTSNMVSGMYDRKELINVNYQPLPLVLKNVVKVVMTTQDFRGGEF